MSKAVLISIRPKWVELIASGDKLIEIRKTKPKLETPFKCYIYQSGKNLTSTVYGTEFSKSGYVVGEFVCDIICGIGLTINEYDPAVLKLSALARNELKAYLGKKYGYGWHISALKIYDKPLRLSDFKQCHKCEYYNGCKEHEYSCDGTHTVNRPPQSFMYVEELTDV